MGTQQGTLISETNHVFLTLGGVWGALGGGLGIQVFGDYGVRDEDLGLFGVCRSGSQVLEVSLIMLLNCSDHGLVSCKGTLGERQTLNPEPLTGPETLPLNSKS